MLFFTKTILVLATSIVAVLAATWGQGKYAMDESRYHDMVKPGLKQAFYNAYGDKFTSQCGKNPDFFCDRKGMVSVSAVEKSKKNLCTNAKFPPLDIGDSHVLPYVKFWDASEDYSYDDEFDYYDN